MAEPLLDRQIRARTLPAARARQPPRPDRRRHRHRQDRHPAALAEALLAASACRCSWPTSRATSPGCRSRAMPTPKIEERIEQLGSTISPTPACPVVFWDVFGEQGHPVRATISEMGPLLLARLLNLNDTQAGRADAGVQDRRRQRPAAARPEGPARDAAARRRERQDSSPPQYGNVSAASHRRHPARPARRSSSRAATSSSASRRSNIAGPDADRRARAAA